jgi:hypothetical protein
MKVGDLVKFFSDESDYAGQVGLVMCVIRQGRVGAEPQVYVQWPAAFIRYPKRQLVVISESRSHG